MTAPYTLLVGDHTVHLLSKYSADASVVIGARVNKQGEAEVTAQSLVAAQREREQQREKEAQVAVTSPQMQPAMIEQAAVTSAKPKSPAVQTAPNAPAIRDFWGAIGILQMHSGTASIIVSFGISL